MTRVRFYGQSSDSQPESEIDVPLGTTPDQCLCYMEDHGYDGIYTSIASEVREGNVSVFSNGKQIGICDEIENGDLSFVHKIAGGNGGGGPVWTLLTSTLIPNGTRLALVVFNQELANYSRHPHEGARGIKLVQWNGSTWTDIGAWTSPGAWSSPGYLQFSSEGFTAGTGYIEDLKIVEFTNAQYGVPALSSYGTPPTASTGGSLPGIHYNGTRRASKTVVQ